MAIGERLYAESITDTSLLQLNADAAAVLYEVEGQNNTAADAWLQIVEVAGGVIRYSFKVAAGGWFSFALPSGLPDYGRPFPGGVRVFWSSQQAITAPVGAGPLYAAGRALA